MEITLATAADVDAVVDQWVALARDQQTYGSHLLASENRTAIREAVLQRVVADELLVARDGETLVGFVMVSMERGRYEQRRTRGLIENIYVRPDYRREGIGSELLAAGEKALAENGATVVALEVMAANESARRFYADHGYAPHRIELEKSTENDTL
ncbi:MULTISPECIES: GNAT family N-acetyltransferase [Haloarcula]|uniref:GNAT family N-acetyltransferase n=1 Tax=Haloarcula pellucida TaxID=1427151 RepID=A0A830GKK4_9EURY|nr:MULTISPECIES: GNAT family N-acetyltransferase [Halomicroarcula]MBX0347779.1 GNAT family N-acetyltransferase [Halomicroarcula pellucida]MDS0276288.1 GNAT family N-acetyltransferase [Halomicroarcula sp. S1AR25-4]GGN90258.1 GNAT family N-acetyltransferase [Halomicroarcula pellucida]